MTSEPAASPRPDDGDGVLLLTPEQAARRLSIGRTRLYDLLRTGHIASIQIGGSRRITPAALRDYVAGVEQAHGQGRSGPRPQREREQRTTTPPGRREDRRSAVAPVEHDVAQRCEPLRLPFDGGEQCRRSSGIEH